MYLKRINILGGIKMLESAVSTYRYPPHWHEEYVIAIYRSGAKKFQCGRHQGTAKAGALLLIAPGTVHSAATFDGIGWNYCSLYLTFDQLSHAIGRENAALASKIKDFTQLTGKAYLARQALQALDAGTGGELAFSSWLLALLESSPEGIKESTHNPPYLSRVYDRIMDDPTLPITLEQLSAVAGVTSEHLSRAFKRTYGLSPFQLLIAARIQVARQLVARGTPLALAAVSAGFSDQSHMTRWIKRSFGVSPGVLWKHQ